MSEWFHSFLPHAVCLRTSGVMIHYVVNNLGIAFGYCLLIPVTIQIADQLAGPAKRALWWARAFIFWCGAGHLCRVANVWLGWYPVENITDTITMLTNFWFVLVAYEFYFTILRGAGAGR